MNSIINIHLQNRIIGATIESFIMGEPIFKESMKKAKTVIHGQITPLYFRINTDGGITSSTNLKTIQKLIFEEKLKEKQTLDMLWSNYESSINNN